MIHWTADLLLVGGEFGVAQSLKGVLYFCSEKGGLWAFLENSKSGHDALRTLENGDHLKIFSKEPPGKVMWSGVIQLETYEPATEDAFGYFINADQKDVCRNMWALWFFNHHPAELTPVSKP